MTQSLLTGFRNFLVLSTGQFIDPHEIEALYTQSAPVKEMCVFTILGMKGHKKSKVLWAVIVPDLEQFREFDEVNLRAVIGERFDNAAQALPVYKRLKGFTLTLKDLPHTYLGAVDTSQVKKIFEPRVLAGLEGNISGGGKISPEDLLLRESSTGKKVLECLMLQSKANQPITLEDSLELDLGIDSLGRIELASRLALGFSADIKPEVISKSFRIKALIVSINEALKDAKAILPSDEGLTLGADYWEEHLNVLPKKETLDMLELGTGYFAWLFRFVITAINFVIFKLFFQIKGQGAEYVPKEGAFILYGNHTSFLDGSAIAACLPRRRVFQLFYFVFGPYFFRPFEKSSVLRNLVKMGRFIPFDYSTHFLEALRSSYYVLQQGKGLCFFPEGLRSTTGEIGEFRKGFGVLAKETGAKLVPVAIDGAHEAWSSTAKFPRCYPIRVRFGKPLLPADLEKQGFAMGAKNSYEAICIAARAALIELKNDKGKI
jgi:long-chain acyl-CoA synthetase